MPTNERSLMELMTTITRVSRSYKALCDRLATKYGLTQAIAWPVLSIHRLGDGVRSNVVAEAVGIEPSSIVRLIDSLVDSGYIERRNDETDRRAKLLYLTEYGKSQVVLIEDELNGLRQHLLKDLTDSEYDTCMQIFSTIGASIKRYKQECENA